MNTLSDSSSIFNYHRTMMAVHGTEGTEALGWRDAHSQQIRFEILTGIADLNNRSVLDAGCGHGDLLVHLRSSYPGVLYTGIEQIPELLEEAVRRYGHLPETEFISRNFITGELPATDYILASGSLNYRSADPNFIYQAISRLYQSSRLGLGFNLLSQIAGNGLIVAYDPEQISAYCNTLCKDVQLKRDYDDDDFTIFMYHDAHVGRLQA